MATQRTPEQIRADIKKNREELAVSIGTLKTEVAEATDWRKQLAANEKNAAIAAAVVGFVVTGGIAAVGGLFRRKKRR